MIALDTIRELINRIGAKDGRDVYLSEFEMSSWPSEAVSALKLQNIVSMASIATSVVCPGCERECIMPVESQTHQNGNSHSFVVCDKRDDINRVELIPSMLTLWKTSAKILVKFLVRVLGVTQSHQKLTEKNLIPLGVFSGEKRHQLVFLKIEREPMLVTGTSRVPLVEVISFAGDTFAIELSEVTKLVDSVCTTNSRYVPRVGGKEIRLQMTKTLHEKWRQMARELRKKHDNPSDKWIAGEIAKKFKDPKRSPDTIRKVIRS